MILKEILEEQLQLRWVVSLKPCFQCLHPKFHNNQILENLLKVKPHSNQAMVKDNKAIKHETCLKYKTRALEVTGG